MKHSIKINIPDHALAVMEKIRACGEEAYIVGGCVRDALLGLAPHDYDMAVSCPPQRTLEILSDFRTIETGLKHGTVTALSQGQPIELTTFRVDGSYSDSRRPDCVSFTRSLAEDLARRDFTINAMAYDSEKGLVDIFGGAEDLQAGLIRAVGNARQRFCEDALRIMRAFRFSAQLGFSIEEATLKGAAECSDRLENIARERIGVEFIKLLTSKAPEASLFKMKELGILRYVSGEYAPSDSVIELLGQMPSVDSARLGFYLCEAEESAARTVLNSLRCSNKQKSEALTVARKAHTAVISPYDVRLLRGSCGGNTVAAVTASVLLGHSQPEAIELVRGDASPVTIGELAIRGEDLEELGYHGRAVGNELYALLDAVLREPKLNQKEKLLELAREHKNLKEEGE